jgi:high affinity Mn2+ porin
VFDLSKKPNGIALDTGFQQYEMVTEFEARHDLLSQPGTVRALLFVNRGRMGSYADAVSLGLATGTVPDTADVRRYRGRPGGALNIEQGLTPTVGAFLRLSANDGSKEAYDFTEINRSLAAGVSVKGALWNRANDTVGLAGAINQISRDARAYFAGGGLGILIGDGALPKARPEKIIETYYKLGVFKGVALTFDYQHIAAPAYDAARGPVNIFGFRTHLEL